MSSSTEAGNESAGLASGNSRVILFRHPVQSSNSSTSHRMAYRYQDIVVFSGPFFGPIIFFDVLSCGGTAP